MKIIGLEIYYVARYVQVPDKSGVGIYAHVQLGWAYAVLVGILFFFQIRTNSLEKRLALTWQFARREMPFRLKLVQLKILT